MTEITNRGDFLPQGYKVPDKSKQFMKLVPGDNVIRILSSPLLGFCVFVKDGDGVKPFRRGIEEGDFNEHELEELSAKKNEKGDFEGGKHFWIMLVWDYAINAPRILEITQLSVLRPLYSLMENPKWPDLRDFDIVIKREGTGKNDTSFEVTPNPSEPLSNEIENCLHELEEKNLLDLNAIWKGDYPFQIYNW